MLEVIPTYWHNSVNFGDAIAPYLVEKITGKKAVFVSNANQEIEHVALIGSLLDNGPLNNTHVWGCGFAYADSPVYEPKKIYAVRGRLSWIKYLEAGIECPRVFGDPALLLPKFYSPNIKKQYGLGIIPHVVDYLEVLKRYANRYENALIIDLSQSVETVIDQILSCQTTISSSLHGLIVSHAYGIPSQWVEFSDKVLGGGFKFRDYLTTVDGFNLPFDLRHFPNLQLIAPDITEHKIKIDLEKLLNSCPLTKP